jgi:hypothetical protein
MLRPKSVRLQMLAMIILLTASTCTSQETSQLKLDSILPPLTGETVSDQPGETNPVTETNPVRPTR